MRPDQIWQAALGELQLQLTKSTFDRWLSGASLLSTDNDVFTIGVESSYAKDWLESRLYSDIKRTLTGIAGRPTNVRFVPKDVLAAGASESRHAGIHKPSEATQKQKGSKSAEEFSERADWHMAVSGVYGDIRTSLLQPEKPTWMSRYFWVRWVPILELERMATILALRQRCYWNPERGELRNTIDLTIPILAKESKIKQRSLERLLEKFRSDPGDPLHIFVLESSVHAEQEKPGGKLSKRTSVWLVRMDDPLTPEDEEFAKKLVPLDVAKRDWEIALWLHEHFRMPLPKARRPSSKKGGSA